MIPQTEEARELELDRLEKQAREKRERTTPVFFKSEIHHLDVFKVEIGFPRYRMENGRTKRKQLEFRHKNKERATELDDPSSDSAQKLQGQILEEMANEEGLLELLKQGQFEPILLSHQGYVVNGNRRLAAMRYLHLNPQKMPKGVDFSFIDVARLPDLDEKEIRRIEQRLQMSKDGKADYNWVDELLTIRENIEDFNMDEAELARDMNKKRPTIDRLLMMLKLIDIYLERNNLKGLYFEVEADEQAFKTLAECHKKFSGDARRQNSLLDLAFPVILQNEPGENKHKRILKIAANLDKVLASVDQISSQLPDPAVEEVKGDILSGVVSSMNSGRKDIPLTKESAAKIQQAIREVDRENELADKANGPAEAVATAASLLRNIKLTQDVTKKPQLRGQLKAIRDRCAVLILELEQLEQR